MSRRPKTDMKKKKSKLMDGSGSSSAKGASSTFIYRGGAALAVLVALYFSAQYWVFTTDALKMEKPLLDKLDRPPVPGQPRLYTYEVVAEYDHDPNAFTQGLLCKPDAGKERCSQFWESTGLFGETSVRVVDRMTGNVLQEQSAIDAKHFGEGLVEYGDELLMLTWRTNQGLAFDKTTLEQTRSFHTPMNDGWGLTVADDGTLIGTDSSEKLFTMTLDPDSKDLVEKRTVTIRDGKRKVKWLNEIEWIEGEVWGNIWQTECIARVIPADGTVVGWILMDGLTRKTKKGAEKSVAKGMDVLNGIAWESEEGRLFMTGKKWPKVYEVELVEIDNSEDQLRKVRKKCIK